MTRRAALGSPLIRAHEIDDLISMLADKPERDRLYVQLVRYKPDAVIHQERLPALPRSVLRVLTQSGHFALERRAVLWETSIPADGIALGNKEVPIKVKR